MSLCIETGSEPFGRRPASVLANYEVWSCSVSSFPSIVKMRALKVSNSEMLIFYQDRGNQGVGRRRTLVRHTRNPQIDTEIGKKIIYGLKLVLVVQYLQTHQIIALEFSLGVFRYMTNRRFQALRRKMGIRAIIFHA